MMRHRVAILGSGVGARHLAGYRALDDRFEVTCICDSDAAAAKALASEAGHPRVVSEIGEALDAADVDIVDICLPPALHVPVSLNALEAGKHVICEKPVAGSVSDAERVAAAATKSDRLFVPVFQYRYGAGFAALIRLKEDGLLGRPLAGTLETHWDRSNDYYANPWRGRWRSELGGAVLGHAVHIHDLATEIVGPVKQVAAMLGTRVNPIETDDCAAVCLAADDGALLTSSVTLGSAGNMSRLRIVFEHATAESGTSAYEPGQWGWRFTARSRKNQKAIDRAVEGVGKVEGGYAGLFKALGAHLDGRGAAPATAEDGVRSIELASSIYQAARTRQVVTLPLDRELPICRSLLPKEHS